MNNRLVSSTILEALGRNGAQRVDELFKQVQKFHGDLDRRFFDESLMALELQGLVTVYSMARDQRRVELAKG